MEIIYILKITVEGKWANEYDITNKWTLPKI